MLRTKPIVMLLGIVVCLCASGCEEEQAVQAKKDGSAHPTTRPVNNKPGRSAPLARTAPTTAPASMPAQRQLSPSPTTQPAPPPSPTDGPVPIHKYRTVARTTSPVNAKSENERSMQNIALTKEQFQLFDTLRQNSLKLQMKLDEVQERNEKLTRALVDSRETGRKLQDGLRRSTIVQEIQKRELQELKDRLGLSVEPKGKSENDTITTTGSSAKVDPTNKSPLDLMDQIRALQRQNEKLQLQLQLAQLDAPDAREKVLLKLGEATERIEELEKLNRTLSHTVVEQDEQIKAQQKQEEKLRTLQADHAARIARMERQMRKQLASVELKIAESGKQIGTLKEEIAEKDRLIALLREEEHAPVSAGPNPDTPRPTPVAKKRIRTVSPTPQRPVETKKPPMVTAVEAAQVQAAHDAGTPSPSVHEPIAGKITAMKGLMVMVDIGLDDGVEDGMRLIVYRADKFIGYLRIEKANRNESACTFTRQILRPKVGDNVIDRLE